MYAKLMTTVLAAFPLAKLVAKIAAVLALGYLCWVPKFGEYTFAQHLKRIWQTSEMIELRESIADKFSGAGKDALHELKAKLAASHED